jgi:hypothetical protein
MDKYSVYGDSKCDRCSSGLRPENFQEMINNCRVCEKCWHEWDRSPEYQLAQILHIQAPRPGDKVVTSLVDTWYHNLEPRAHIYTNATLLNLVSISQMWRNTMIESMSFVEFLNKIEAK